MTTENIQRETYVRLEDLNNKIGILDPEAKEINPLTGEKYANLYKETSGTYAELASKIWTKLPMYGIRESSIKSLYENQVVLIESGTGSGKTVLTPKFLLHALNYKGRIAITNPKRIPSSSNASFAAMLLDVKLGEHVGIKYRGSRSQDYSDNCKLVYCTDGMVLAQLKSDPMLSNYDAVIIDEAHERGLQIDLLLVLLKDLVLKRPDFKLVIMSATINTQMFKDYFPSEEFRFGFIDAGEKPNFGITEYYLPKGKDIHKFNKKGILINLDYVEVAVKKVLHIMKTSEKGDILVFFTSRGDCGDGCRLLHDKLSIINEELDKQLYCEVLTASTPQDVKDILESPDKYKTLPKGPYTRKVIFATEVAESSMTFDGTDFVIDTGLVYKSRYYADTDVQALEKTLISRASHKQRRGRTGRTAPGTCYNLFTRDIFNKMQPYTTAPILEQNISDSLLRFLSRQDLVTHINLPFRYLKKTKQNEKIDTQDLSTYLQKFIEPPYESTVRILLRRIEALGGLETRKNSNGDVMKNKLFISPMGLGMAAFGMSAELSRSLIAGYNYGCIDEICNIVAMFEKSDYRMDKFFSKPRFRGTPKEVKDLKQKYQKKIKYWNNPHGDHITMLRIYREYSRRAYDKVLRNGKVIPKLGDANIWARNYYLNKRFLGSIKNTSKQISRLFGKVIRISREHYPELPKNLIFRDKAPVKSKFREENILKALLEGYYINLIKSYGKNYSTCFPKKRSSSRMDRDSYFHKKSKYAFYSMFNSMAGNDFFTIVSKVPQGVITRIKNEHSEKLKICFEEPKKINEKKSEPKKKKKSEPTKKKKSEPKKKKKSEPKKKKKSEPKKKKKSEPKKKKKSNPKQKKKLNSKKKSNPKQKKKSNPKQKKKSKPKQKKKSKPKKKNKKKSKYTFEDWLRDNVLNVFKK